MNPQTVLFYNSSKVGVEWLCQTNDQLAVQQGDGQSQSDAVAFLTKLV